MNKVKINLNNIAKVQRFATVVTNYEADINIYKDNPNHSYDAKSILAIFAIDLTSPLTVEIITSREDELIRFIKEMREFE